MEIIIGSNRKYMSVTVRHKNTTIDCGLFDVDEALELKIELESVLDEINSYIDNA